MSDRVELTDAAFKLFALLRRDHRRAAHGMVRRAAFRGTSRCLCSIAIPEMPRQVRAHLLPRLSRTSSTWTARSAEPWCKVVTVFSTG
jgi:hypothetical protein